MDAPNDFAARLTAVAAETDALLDRLLDDRTAAGRNRAAARGCSPPCAMPCSAAASGCGRFCWWRPQRCSARARDGALLAGAALECLHCYSLVHDDLPAMDDDELRRGRPTVHKAFDEATAILAGDALLTLAFDIMARAEIHPDANVRIALVAELARAAGLGGMAGGQMLDLAAEGRFEAKRTQGENEIATLQAMKTGALIALRLPGRRDSRASRRPGARQYRPLRRGDRPGVPDRRRSARRRGRRGHPRQGRRQGCRRRQGDTGRGAGRRRRARPARCTDRASRCRAGAVRRESRYTARRRALHRPAAKLKRTIRTDPWPKAKSTPPLRPLPIRLVKLHAYLFIGTIVGVGVATYLPGHFRLTTRLLVGWDIGVAIYLVLIQLMMMRCNVDRIRRRAAEQDEGAFAILLLIVIATMASLVAIVVELGGLKQAPQADAITQVLLAVGDHSAVMGLRAYDLRVPLCA